MNKILMKNLNQSMKVLLQAYNQPYLICTNNFTCCSQKERLCSFKIDKNDTVISFSEVLFIHMKSENLVL